MHKRLQKFHKKFDWLKKLNPKRKKIEDLKANVLEDAGDHFNELRYIYKEKYEEENDVLNRKDIKKFDYTKLRLTDDYLCESEEEKKQADEKATEDNVEEFNDLIVKEEMSMSKELFQKHFKYKMPTDLLNAVYNTGDKKKNDALVKLIKSGLSDLKKMKLKR